VVRPPELLDPVGGEDDTSDSEEDDDLDSDDGVLRGLRLPISL
jgi:hypothetical protein